jgi:hypothetical protein
MLLIKKFSDESVKTFGVNGWPALEFRPRMAFANDSRLSTCAELSERNYELLPTAEPEQNDGPEGEKGSATQGLAGARTSDWPATREAQMSCSSLRANT